MKPTKLHGLVSMIIYILPVYENIVKLTSNVWLGILNLKNAKH